MIGLLYWRQRKGREDRTRLGERQGHPSRARPRGPSGLGPWRQHRRDPVPAAGRGAPDPARARPFWSPPAPARRPSLIARRLPPGAVHQFVPLDVPRYIRRFLDHWQPDLALVAESEIWPNTVIALDQRHIPLVLVNGRMSDRSYPALAEAAAHHRRPARALRPVPRPDPGGCGAARAPRRAPRVARDRATSSSTRRRRPPIRGWWRICPAWSPAGRSGLPPARHPGEESAIVAVHRALAQRHPHLLTIIAPRHPHRGEEVAAIAARAGLRAGRRSQGHASRPGDGRLRGRHGRRDGPVLPPRRRSCSWAARSCRIGGHNPIEPAKLGAAILHGPHVHNATEIYAALDQARGALMVKDSAASRGR